MGSQFSVDACLGWRRSEMKYRQGRMAPDSSDQPGNSRWLLAGAEKIKKGRSGVESGIWGGMNSGQG